jgi:hypothetical protein
MLRTVFAGTALAGISDPFKVLQMGRSQVLNNYKISVFWEGLVRLCQAEASGRLETALRSGQRTIGYYSFYFPIWFWSSRWRFSCVKFENCSVVIPGTLAKPFHSIFRRAFGLCCYRSKNQQVQHDSIAEMR